MRSLIIISLVISLAACGQTGPLYLPGQDKPIKEQPHGPF